MLNFTATTPKSTFTEDGRYLRSCEGLLTPRRPTPTESSATSSEPRRRPTFFAYVSHQAPTTRTICARLAQPACGRIRQGLGRRAPGAAQRQIELGIMPAGTGLSERMWFVPDPTLLAPAPRAVLGKKMELYAGMVENLDFHVGR